MGRHGVLVSRPTLADRSRPARLARVLAPLLGAVALSGVCGVPTAPTITSMAEACRTGLAQTFQCDPCFLTAGGRITVLQNGATQAECDRFLAGRE